MSPSSPTLARVLGDWTPDPGLIVTCCAAAGLYVWGVARAPGRWPLRRLVSFIAGLFAIALALLSGIDYYADYLLSMHMIEHLLLILLAPMLLLWGAPVRLALSACGPAGRGTIGAALRARWVHVITRPAFGLALFTLVLLGTHLTGVYELALRNQTIHELEHAAYFWSGIVFLAPLLACDPIPHPPSAIARFSWLMAAMTVMAIPAGIYLFDAHVYYPYYLSTAHALQTSALVDQQAAGSIMLFGGGTIMGALAILIAMQAMLAEERRQRRRDAYAPLPFPGGGETK